MPQVFETKCPDCGEVIEWCYERSVYNGEIQCPNCDTFIVVNEDQYNYK